MKTIRFLLKTILYCVYVLATQEQRHMWTVSKNLNKNCTSVTWKGNKYYCTFDNKSIERQYLTWKEFRILHKF